MTDGERYEVVRRTGKSLIESTAMTKERTACVSVFSSLLYIMLQDRHKTGFREDFGDIVSHYR